ncbi:MAG: polyisoprenoid-binding protein, partial [Burkholderiales bacterium]
MLVALPNLANAQQRVVPAQSEIAFVSKQFGVPVGGKFKKFDAEV